MQSIARLTRYADNVYSAKFSTRIHHDAVTISCHASLCTGTSAIRYNRIRIGSQMHNVYANKPTRSWWSRISKGDFVGLGQATSGVQKLRAKSAVPFRRKRGFEAGTYSWAVFWQTTLPLILQIFINFRKEKNSRQVINLDNRTQNEKNYILSINLAIFCIFHRCLPLCLILLQLLCPVTNVGALSEAGVCPSVRPSVCLSDPCP